MRGGHGKPRAGIALAAVATAAALALPAASQAAQPNAGAWNSNSYSQPITFTVNPAKTVMSDFTPAYRVNWTCGSQGAWTEVGGVDIPVSSSGSFSVTDTIFISGLNRNLTLTVSGQFDSPSTVYGQLLWSMQGCTSQSESFTAYGPEVVTKAKKKKKKKKKKKRKRKRKKGGGGGGGGDDEACIPIPLPDGSGFICV